MGGTAKAGVFLKNNILVGASVEVHDLFSMRKEAGLFARKYINSNRFMVYIQPGLSYGTFKSNNFDIDASTENQELTALKLNFSAGSEIRISEMISFEGEAGIGRVMSANWWAPSIRTSINFRIKSSKR
ncbi:hypothetical protein [Algoriphagus resistens]|uniref:hypothetical protein n=1 Tax=Algoriphagus resistens TaxID=1750590 RepID=UPI000716AE75|nr:hypothetical protein [Algoriphagus resistens]